MISIIVAIGKNNLIGKGNDLPWHYKSDLKYFKDTTIGKKVVMGKNTFLSIVNRLNKPLPGRQNVVVTRDKDFRYNDVEVVNDFLDYLNQEHHEEVFIIGGSQIYNIALPYTDRLYITFVNEDHQGDAYFPIIDYSKFKLISKRDEGVLSFCVYERIK